MDTPAQELEILKTIAQTLNECGDPDHMLSEVLHKLLELTGLTAGWIFLLEDTDSPQELKAACGMPPALCKDGMQPMCSPACWCLNRYRDGRLQDAVNILNCKRLEDAVDYKWGDTCGITHHATIPLVSGTRRFGLMNVAAPGKEHFTDRELALLQSVAYQIGGTLERIRLWQAEQHRGDLFARLGEFSRALDRTVADTGSRTRLEDESIRLLQKHFHLPLTALYRVESGLSYISGAAGRSNCPIVHTTAVSGAARLLTTRVGERRYAAAEQAEMAEWTHLCRSHGSESELSHVLAVPLPLSGNRAQLFLLAAYPSDRHTEEVDAEVLEAAAEHIAIALEHLQLEENRRKLARLEERNRLARDLHDSVSQMLFSLSLTARGVESMLGGSEQEHQLLEAVSDMRTLSQAALKEMRSLITQLRPAGLEEGLTPALQNYARQLGLRVHLEVNGIAELPSTMEEALWRIGQEALNNISKHAGTRSAEIRLSARDDAVTFHVADQGRGGAATNRPREAGASYGLTMMKERAEALGGRLVLYSVTGKGTTVEVRLPIEKYIGEEGDSR
ncbi:GAF domain-containing sensor histidine kinase [Paenibacillus sp. JX-17]|uniref:Oxygen sensor histidine kinase NreB n=1 Tax=Paenibacillus lacisoli TaxID=3064525 RepID=A0ABT9CG14_9BACL|nr:GAF domain-containing sensor histidine kinase [Paenibacillus sp. JX-17]MDO7908223.1 GAF domain-containing sensor histidine kinase [Paenibacillus sp. JX-17]